MPAPVWPDGAIKGGEQDRTFGAQSDAECQIGDLLSLTLSLTLSLSPTLYILRQINDAQSALRTDGAEGRQTLKHLPSGLPDLITGRQEEVALSLAL